MLNAVPGEMLADRTTKTCSRCGGPLELRHLQGMEVEVCVRCGAAVLDRADLENLAASAVMSAPEAPVAEAAAARSSATPARPERKKPWDFTPRPAPPRRPPRRMEKTLIPTLAEEGLDDETEEGPMVVGHRIHESEPPVRPREVVPDSELPTGPPTPAPVGRSPRPAVPKAPAPSGPGAGSGSEAKGSKGPPPLTLKPEPSFRVGGPPTPPPSLGRTVRPEDGNAPLVRPAGAVTMSSEPDIGSLPPGPVVGPGIDLGEPEPSTEEAPRVVSSGDLSPWADREESGEWESGGSRVRTFLFAASALAAVGALATLLALGAWVFWLGPIWRERVATADGPELAQIVGTPAGDVVVEHPEPIDPGEDAAPVAAPTPDPVEVAVAPVPDPIPAPEPPEPVAEPTPAPEPRPAPATSRKTLIAKGWDTVESDPDTAMAAFGQVLETDPSDYEAAYGYGYALLEKGDPASAGVYLCRARPSPDVTIQREVAGLLAGNGITCP